MSVSELTENPGSRISQTFRAIKAISARKRPRDLSSSSAHPFPPHSISRIEDADRAEVLLPVHVTKRAPLSEVPVNIPSSFPENSSKNKLDENGGTSHPENLAANQPNGMNSVSTRTAYTMDSPEMQNILDWHRTLDKETQARKPFDYFSTMGLLDDYFDESILEEIDHLCKQKSAAKAVRWDQGYYSHEESECLSNGVNGVDASSGCSTMTAPIKTKGSLDILDCMAPRLERLETLHGRHMPEEYTKYLQTLNDRQREAACSDISIPLMIVAGPGSGKTSTMVGRILKLLNEGINPSNILAMTFTTAAASEMRDRIGAVAGKATAKEIMISTFHSFSLQLCRSHAEKLGRTTEFLIYGQGQQRRVIIEAVRLLENEEGTAKDVAFMSREVSNCLVSLLHFKDKARKWQKFVTQAKASGKTPEECSKIGDKIGAAILANYNHILKSCNALDYNDLISCSVELLTDFPEVHKECQDSWKAIVIDEFQDTSAMQYNLLKILASHHKITVVGDDDQSIFSFNGADISGFDSFRNDFPNFKEIRLNKNYRSTRFIVEAASSLIRNNLKRCQLKIALTDNSFGSQITIKECRNEDSQCAFVIDKILEITSNCSYDSCSYGNIAILYRRQVSGKLFQNAFRERKIPFNVHGVAFYRKKVVRAIIAMLRTSLPGCDDASYRRVFKALLPFEKDEKKRVIEHIEKILTIRKCSFFSAASDIFAAKISGTFKRNQLTQGRKVLLTLAMISRLVHREQSISTVITSVANMIPQRYLLEQRAVVDVDGGRLLNEDNDVRSVLQYLLDDVSDFFSSKFIKEPSEKEVIGESKGCLDVLKAFIDYLLEREKENFHSRRQDNKNAVTLTTIHQSKGLEWDAVFIIKVNDSEIPLLHEFNGVVKENGVTVEEERRLLYVAMTRARKNLFILFCMMDSNWQMLQPSRFLKEIPDHLCNIQAERSMNDLQTKEGFQKEALHVSNNLPVKNGPSKVDMMPNHDDVHICEVTKDFPIAEENGGNNFLRRFNVEERSAVSHLFHHWAKKKAFQDPKRLLDKVGFVIDERLRAKNKHKDLMNSLKSCLCCDEAFQYAEYVLRWEQIPMDERALFMREKQAHFQKLRIESSMSSSAPTEKQISYLRNLGCTVTPTSRLQASHLIGQYKSL